MSIVRDVKRTYYITDEDSVDKVVTTLTRSEDEPSITVINQCGDGN